MATCVLSMANLQSLLDMLSDQGHEILGPTVRDGAVTCDHLHSIQDLPIGLYEVQSGGHYRLKGTGSGSLFSYTTGPQSWKRFLLPPERDFLEIQTHKREVVVSTDTAPPQPMAFFGVRACDMAALERLDKVLSDGPYQASHYKKRRDRTVVIAVNCTRAGDTCFCASMQTGPRVTGGFDILLTELVASDGPYCLAEAGTGRGEDLLAALDATEASEDQVREADEAVKQAADSMGRSITTDNLPDILKASLDDPQWEKIASRCLSCGNCTMVCPTCFCSTTEDTTDLSGSTARRIQRWDSCHTVEFTYIHGGSIRTSVMSRYRQWMMHKLAYWPEQFGSFGCVGCGRCITWCPTGIDITEEAGRFREKAAR
ncbi:MAG: 4Fe-4S dicluster domain-containing protein [candidate division Zixibacteria bacterium]|nr:4Fe-4S dicluster domain-containing protein [candidate division Zixibacteria bacterium]